MPAAASLLPPGYALDKSVQQPSDTWLFARTLDTDEPVVVKTLGDRRPTTQNIALFRHEYQILQDLDLPGVIRVRDLVFEEGRPYLVMERCGEMSLRHYLAAHNPLSRDAFYTIASSLARIIDGLHGARVIHKNINPDHIFVHPDTLAVCLVDFAVASVLPKETQKLAAIGSLDGNLAYISPEQTGRMNRAIDVRSDAYALGITLYEMLAGRLPYTASSPLEWVHCHIAKTPVALREAAPEVPPALAAVVMKLFEKAAENRYQSMYGLLEDLRLCQAMGDDPNRNTAFAPATFDRAEQFQLSQKLYGRERHRQVLLDAFAAVCQGPSAMMLVAGYSGIGKTSLIAEIHKPVLGRQGYFISGKFDQFKRRIPYASLIQAFRELVRQLLTESEASLAAWRERLESSLGTSGQVIIDVIPEVEILMGPQPKVPKLESAEAQNRFNRVFQQFVGTFASEEHPLVVFLDDLQWADLASLKLLGLLCSDPNSRHLFLVGAYRDNEVDTSHPLCLLLKDLEANQIHVKTLQLEPLSQPQVERFIADTLHASRRAVTALAVTVHNKTLGNPFFVAQCLHELHASKLLTYCRDKNAWTWNLEQIEDVGISDNVVDLMTGKLKRLSAQAQSTLTLAACIGASFDLESLAIVGASSVAGMVARLEPALHQGLVVPNHDPCRVLQRGKGTIAESESDDIVSCRFLHDRVQQAAYALLSPEERTVIHLKIGRRMLEQLEGAEGDRLFDIVNHMNAGSALIEDPAERLKLAKLNLRMGQRARDSAAYDSAASYLRAGIALLPQDYWKICFELAFDLHKALSECAYLLREFDEAESLFERLQSRARTPHEHAEVYNTRIAFYSSVGRFTDAIEAGFEGLELYGIDLRSAGDDLPGAIEAALTSIEAQLAQQNLQGLIKLPRLADPDVEDSMHLLMNLTTQTYIADQKWFPLIAMKMVSLSLLHGNCAASSFGYGYLGVIVGMLRGHYELGRELGDLSLELNSILGEQDLYCKLYWIHGGLNNHWTRHIKTNILLLRDSIHHGVESGDYVFGSWAYYYLVVSSLLSGELLAGTLQEADDALAFFRKVKNQTYIDLMHLVRNVALNLQGLTPDRQSLSYETFDEKTCIDGLKARSHGAGIGRYNVMKLMVLCIHEEYDAACAIGAESELTLCHLAGQPLLAEHYFYRALSLAGRYTALPRWEQDESKLKACTTAITKMLRQLDIWADACPDNYLPKKLLVAAELARLQGDLETALPYYAQASDAAREHGFVQNEALANLLTGRCLMAHGLSGAGRSYLRIARNLYAQWGAQSRVQDLDEQGVGLTVGDLQQHSQDQARPGNQELGPNPNAAIAAASSPPFASLGSASSSAPSMGPTVDHLDAMTLVKATRAISSELEVGSLFEKMMAIMVESVGADTGFLFREEDGELILKTRYHVRSEDKDAPPRYAEGAVNYVRRSGKTIVLGDALHDTALGSDPHIESQEIMSLLCTPMRRGDAIVGTLYFENPLPDAFTPDRVGILDILAAQAAVSLENASIHNELHKVNSELESRVQDLTAMSRQLRDSLLQLRGAQEELVQSTRLASVGEMAGRTAHEVLNPISSIHGRVSRMLQSQDKAYGQNLELFAEIVESWQQAYANGGAGGMLAALAADASNKDTETFEDSEMREGDEENDALSDGAALFEDDLEALAQLQPYFAKAGEQVTASCKFLIREVDRVTHIVDGMRSLTRASTTREPVPVAGMLAEAGEILQDSLDKRNIRLQVESDIKADVMVDRYEIIQVLTNLMRNGMMAIEEKNGRSGGLLKLWATQNNTCVDIHIQDSGTGIQDKHLPYIFESNFTTRSAKEGTGLGLGIAKRLVRGCGGELVVGQTEVGVGTTFVVHIPKCEAECSCAGMGEGSKQPPQSQRA